ncbi:hypothetical protein MAFF301069_27020 [Ralstonia pseudosolanacearum]|nr:hypothetical protein MAFF211471_28670 [Ralstonia solanacearum]BEU52658.1 hypothetical protein MAFF211520_29500 [Ralstonia pseudosolanacearum]BCL93015.1 hypothetical protein MAFF211479_27160 [Ralstonia solanacearum]BCL96603.1 hypothetical protein MAFF211491_10550 [Ralstonia solanacearum]BCM08402.1 hypothetical protein MAFF241647_27590 [Ralstonia solanacearum]
MGGAVRVLQAIERNERAGRAQRQQGKCDKGFEQDGAAREMGAQGAARAEGGSLKWHGRSGRARMCAGLTDLP